VTPRRIQSGLAKISVAEACSAHLDQELVIGRFRHIHVLHNVGTGRIVVFAHLGSFALLGDGGRHVLENPQSGNVGRSDVVAGDQAGEE
jgi:hypothetical protein